MKKYLTIIFIFLASFIIAGANASFSNAAAPQFIQIHSKTQIGKNSAFLHHENFVNKEHTTIHESDKDSESFNQTTESFHADKLNNQSLNIDYEFSNLVVKNNNTDFKNIKYNLYPRAP